MLPPEILDQVTSLTTQHREIVSIINQLSRPNEIKSQLILDDLVAKIKAGFAEADRAIENLDATVETEDDPAVKNEGEVYLVKIVEDFKLARSLFRKLLLQASKTLHQSRHIQASEALFQSQSTQVQSSPVDSNTTLRQRHAPISNDSSLLTAATDVTLALKRTHALLEQELEKSTLSLETLDHSSQTLRQLDNKYDAFDGLLRGSKRLIIELERADKWDRWMIYGGLAMFGLTCLWIVYKRIVRGPLGLVMWVAGKALGSGAVSSRSKENAASIPKSEVKTDRLMQTGFEASDKDEALWSEGFDDVFTEVVTVTIEV